MKCKIDDQKLENSKIEVVGSLGIATDLLKLFGNLKPHASWIGITTSEKTYPDEMIVEYSKWASDQSKKVYVIVADGMQAYNRVPFSKKSWDKIYDVRSDIKSAKRRKENLEKLLDKSKLSNVSVKLWNSELMQGLINESSENSFLIGYVNQLFGHQAYGRMHDDIRQTVRNRASHLLKRAEKEGIGREHAEFAFSCYVDEQILLTWALAQFNIATIKIGPETERQYDQIVLNLIQNKYGDFTSEEIPFGAVYLRQKEKNAC